MTHFAHTLGVLMVIWPLLAMAYYILIGSRAGFYAAAIMGASLAAAFGYVGLTHWLLGA